MIAIILFCWNDYTIIKASYIKIVNPEISRKSRMITLALAIQKNQKLQPSGLNNTYNTDI